LVIKPVIQTADVGGNNGTATCFDFCRASKGQLSSLGWNNASCVNTIYHDKNGNETNYNCYTTLDKPLPFGDNSFKCKCEQDKTGSFMNFPNGWTTKSQNIIPYYPLTK
jgi:hypothetical protein